MATPAVAPNRDAATAASRRAVKFFVPGLLLAVLAVMMLEQSGRWLLTAMSRASFVRNEFEITNLRDQPGRGGFGYGGRVVSTGETVASKSSIIVSLERLRELDAAGAIPGARVPIYYLPPRQPWTALDYAIAFRVQSPDDFEIDASVWLSSTRLSRWARSG